ncbi:hypothetical protein [Bdellovibrio svalbardensis]|uniref:Uncharacterized protein n=1 Tax=Bdellovibrio svalbardensis TaxID=2972972 RepID=A0ABT6DDZ3_9BACT|nr:hypothetical protein [Bdellovibrio svalbardensis]MDG0815008.1 hypothetical protein [Bdellovibrio svalbardensis]
MKSLVVIAFLAVTYFLYGFYINQYEVSTIPRQLTAEHAANYYDYKGVLNVHTDLSAGSAPASFVITSAKLANLDFLMFTDVNMFNVPTTFESYHGNLLVFSAGKYSYLDARLIYYSLNQEAIGNGLGDAQVKLADLLSQKTGASKDTLTVLAHPYKAGYNWNGEIPTGLDGFELWNQKSLSNRAWAESKLSVIWSLLIYPFNPRLSILRLYTEPSDELALLDKISTQRKIVIYAGTEASARAIPLANYLIRFPSYKRTFEVMSNHIMLKSELTGSFNSDRVKVFNALKNGNSYLALDMLGDPKGFVATIDEDNRSHLMGSEMKLSKNMILKVKLPAKPKDFFEIRVLRNGETVAQVNDPEVNYPITQTGTYRVQVRVSPMLPLPDAKKWITWIYTNPFYVQP